MLIFHKIELMNLKICFYLMNSYSKLEIKFSLFRYLMIQFYIFILLFMYHSYLRNNSSLLSIFLLIIKNDKFYGLMKPTNCVFIFIVIVY